MKTITEGYSPTLNLIETEIAIKVIKDYFEDELSKKLNLIRVSAPILVRSGKGLNDNLNGVERPVAFDAKSIEEGAIEVVQSLAKWKRIALGRYKFKAGEGLYTDMNAIRRDEDLDDTHSLYVDQWDWEKVIDKEERNEEILIKTVNRIYEVFKSTEALVTELYPQFEEILPRKIFFITSQELEDRYPSITSKEREDKIAEEQGAVFIMKIGEVLDSGEKHDGRAPDYDDWSLNGDIIFWNPVLKKAFEVSSMGVRVDEKVLRSQLKASGCEDRAALEYHKAVLEGKLPYTIGGGIGQSRICMFFLRKAHIGEVQAGIWPEDIIESCERRGIVLL
ncbi:aspartate--ammonia ligase [Clostridium polynesiense]|uniref:aspartate--ammonia ligase n=1 Tax=Clostridium polynesiense TaxID=1325933 RepID=UPI00058DD8E6|nr:aspartate--ammonia ligase [Clostridium polynesiense]